eukprot:scaffold6433_cov121-Skeletonema_marinoi.AAC.2
MELGRHYGEARATLQMRNLIQQLHNCLQNTSTPHIGCRPRITQGNKRELMVQLNDFLLVP